MQIITIKYIPFTISMKPNVKQQFLVYTDGLHLLGLTLEYTFAVCEPNSLAIHTIELQDTFTGVYSSLEKITC